MNLGNLELCNLDLGIRKPFNPRLGPLELPGIRSSLIACRDDWRGWKTLAIDSTKSVKGHQSQPRVGILEILAHSTELVWQTSE